VTAVTRTNIGSSNALDGSGTAGVGGIFKEEHPPGAEIQTNSVVKSVSPTPS
jgi:hypothetical protein